MKYAEKGPIIARNGAEVDAALRKMGYDPKTVYFKRDPRLFFEYEGETKGLFESAMPREEYAKLSALYTADPIHVVRPIAEIKNGTHDGALFVGFVMEEAKGTMLGNLDYDSYYSEKSRAEIRGCRIKFVSALEDLISAVNGLHEKGLYHGDLNYFNIIVNRRGRVKLIDPYVMDPKDARVDDMSRIAAYEKKLEHLKSLLRE